MCAHGGLLNDTIWRERERQRWVGEDSDELRAQRIAFVPRKRRQASWNPEVIQGGNARDD